MIALQQKPKVPTFLDKSSTYFRNSLLIDQSLFRIQKQTIAISRVYLHPRNV